MEIKQYKYFKRDISWLSFNYRVLMEAKNESLPIYERIKFLAIYSSNLEEFYKVRVSGYHSSILKSIKRDESIEEALKTLIEINDIVTEQEREYNNIFYKDILCELKKKNIILYQGEEIEPFHKTFIEQYFNEEVFPFLQPMIIQKGGIHSFIQDNSIYLVISLTRKLEKKGTVRSSSDLTFALMKIPDHQIERFVELPSHMPGPRKRPTA